MFTWKPSVQCKHMRTITKIVIFIDGGDCMKSICQTTNGPINGNLKYAGAGQTDFLELNSGQVEQKR